MKLVPNLFRTTSIVVFLQLLLGGLLTFGFIAPPAHIVTGFIVLTLAIATMIFVFVSKPSFPPLKGISIGMIALIIVQIILGFETLSSGNQIRAWVHFAVAMGIYAMSLTGSVMAFSWNRTTRTQVSQQQETQKV